MNSKKIIFSGLILLYSQLMFSAPSKGNELLNWFYNNIILVMGFMVIIGALFSLWNLGNAIMERKIIDLRGEDFLKKRKQGPSVFKKMYDKAWNLIPMDKESDIDLGHEYDGIRELDNSLPPWWIYTFYITIIWGFGYIYVYHLSDVGMDQKTEYLTEMESAKVEMRNYLARKGDNIDENTVVFVSDTESLEAGKAIFLKSCATCHGVGGEGGIGPNMTDKYWIHGGGIKDLFKTIKYGVPQKGMVPWEAQLQPKTIRNVASYILSLQGTNPPNQKAAQGDFYESNEANQVTEAEEKN